MLRISGRDSYLCERAHTFSTRVTTTHLELSDTILEYQGWKTLNFYMNFTKSKWLPTFLLEYSED